ncbi:MAG: hypothetical protein ACT4R6_02080, partial [Gemmatimonadaceae bacterium]
MARGAVAAWLRGAADQVQQYSALADVNPELVGESPAVIVLAPDATPTRFLEASIRRYRAADLVTPILLCIAARSRSGHQLAALVHAGLDAVVRLDDPQVAQRIYRDVRARLNAVLPASLVRHAFPKEAAPVSYCGWCVRNVFRELDVDSVAEWFGAAPSTVNRRLHRAGLASLGKIIRSARLLHVMYRLERQTTAVRVA